MNLSDSTDISNMCLREMIYTAQFPVIFSETIDWDILEWTSQDWSNAFRDQLLPFRCGTKKCQEVKSILYIYCTRVPVLFMRF